MEIEEMLVLSRKDGESVRIGEDILVKVSKIRGGRVQIAIDAPDDIRIRRSELDEKRATPVPNLGSSSLASYQSVGVDL